MAGNRQRMTLDDALLARYTSSHTGQDGVFTSQSVFSPARAAGRAPPFGAWCTTTEALALQSLLAEAAAALPAPLSDGTVHDLLVFCARPDDDSTAHVRRREAYADVADPRDALTLPVPVPSSAASLGDAWEEKDDSCEPSALVMQHRFLLRDGRELTLRTLLVGERDCLLFGLAPAAFAEVAFCNTPVAAQTCLDADWKHIAPTASAVALDGAWLTATQLATLPKAVRAALEQCRAAQLVSTMRCMLKRRWAGGFSMMRSRVAPVLSPAANAAVQALAAVICLERCEGSDGSIQLMHIWTVHAEYLEAQRHFSEAANLYELILDSESRLGLADDPADAWVALGLRRVDMKEYSAALQAFQHALAANDISARDQVNHDFDFGLWTWFNWRHGRSDADRRSQRLRLQDMMVMTMAERDLGTGVVPLDARVIINDMLAPFLVIGVDTPPPIAGSTAVQVVDLEMNFFPASFVATAVHSGARFIIHRPPPGSGSAHHFRVVRVPPGEPLPPGATEPPAREEARRARVNVHEYMAHKRASGASLPRLPPTACGRCGATAPKMKVCGACRQVAYCGPECQRVHWREVHKQECQDLAAAAAEAD